ncbi:MAG: hypothetical protein IPG45_19390 [Deltaproteobacteria bacterium]|jgi:hypothetical protein|nr:hypothetical protein [Deltaproteobacteria bacterium]
MRETTFDLNRFVLPLVTIAPAPTAPRNDTPKVGAGLFKLWNQFQAQLKGMVDPELEAASKQAAEKHVAGELNAAEYKRAIAQALRNSKDVADPGVDRMELMAALRDVKDNLKNTGLDPQTRMELMGYAQTLLDGLARTPKKSVEVGQMTSWLLVGLGFKGEGLS